MKRVILLILIAAVLLCGCESFLYEPEADPEPYTVTVDKNGQSTTLIIDPLTQTIQDGFYTYDYDLTQEDIVIYYPEEEGVFSRGFDEEIGSYITPGEEGEEFLVSAYIDGNTLVNIVEQQMSQQRRSIDLSLAMILVGVTVAAVGLWRRTYPYYPWRKILGISSKKRKHQDDSEQKHKHKHISGTVNRRLGVSMMVCGGVLMLVGFIL